MTSQHSLMNTLEENTLYWSVRVVMLQKRSDVCHSNDARTILVDYHIGEVDEKWSLYWPQMINIIDMDYEMYFPMIRRCMSYSK